MPFGVGERLEYQVKYKGIPVGSGDMEVLPMDTVRGVDTWHTVFRIKGGFLFYRVNDKYEAWLDAHTLSSLRYWQDIDEGSYEPKRHYEIFPDKREYVENNKAPAAERRAPARRWLVPLLSPHGAASRRDGHDAQRLLQGREESDPFQGAPQGHHRRSRRPIPGDRRAADLSIEPVLRGRTRRGLAFRRRQPHHAADEVERALRFSQPLPQIVPPAPPPDGDSSGAASKPPTDTATPRPRD